MTVTLGELIHLMALVFGVGVAAALLGDRLQRWLYTRQWPHQPPPYLLRCDQPGLGAIAPSIVLAIYSFFNLLMAGAFVGYCQ